jgi:aspartate aminotransferase-like enzyme
MDDKRLFTPGPLTTSEGVKRAMLRDIGSRETEAGSGARFAGACWRSRRRGEAVTNAWMQGSGTFNRARFRA